MRYNYTPYLRKYAYGHFQWPGFRTWELGSPALTQPWRYESRAPRSSEVLRIWKKPKLAFAPGRGTRHFTRIPDFTHFTCTPVAFYLGLPYCEAIFVVTACRSIE